MSTTKTERTPGMWYAMYLDSVEPLIMRRTAEGREVLFAATDLATKSDVLTATAAPDAHRILTRLGQSLRDGGEPSLYAKMDTGETIADAIEAYLKKVEVE